MLPCNNPPFAPAGSRYFERAREFLKMQVEQDRDCVDELIHAFEQVELQATIAAYEYFIDKGCDCEFCRDLAIALGPLRARVDTTGANGGSLIAPDD